MLTFAKKSCKKGKTGHKKMKKETKMQEINSFLYSGLLLFPEKLCLDPEKV
jgi:hypothetical protein